MVDVLATEQPDLQTMLVNFKTLVLHFKHMGLQHELKQTLKLECPTKWNSTFFMLDSMLFQHDEVQNIFYK